MLNLQHNVVSMLYAIKGSIESHKARAEENGFEKTEAALDHAEEVLRRVYLLADRALQITKRLGMILKSQTPPVSSGNGCPKSNLHEVWRRTLEFLEKEYTLREVEILERIPNHFPILACSREDLREILYYLAKNAVQAMTNPSPQPSPRKRGEGEQQFPSPLRGEGRVRGRLILRAQLGFSTKEEPLAVFTLSDTGPGIGEDKLPFLFHPFYTTKPEGVGNGLGLYLTRALVTRNRGRISVSSFPGTGTTFVLEFPLAGNVSLAHSNAA